MRVVRRWARPRLRPGSGPVARSAALHDSDVDSLVADELYLDIASLDPRQRRRHDIVVVFPGQPEGLQSVADSQAPALGLDAVMHTDVVEDAERFEQVKEPERLVVKGQHGGVGLHHGHAHQVRFVWTGSRRNPLKFT